MTATKITPKRMELGIEDAMAAAKQVARDDNVPSLSFPNNQRVEPQPDATTSKGAGNVTPLPQPITERKSRGPHPAPVRRYSVDLPVYLIDEIHTQAFKSKRTKKRLILEALKAGGLPVKDIDIQESAADA